MKKFILPCALALLAVSAGAEEMRLVTLLSQPVGSFARVELLDSSKPAKIYNLNFCNNSNSGGTITVTGVETDNPVNATYLVSESGSTLSSSEEQGAPVRTYKVVSGGSTLSSDGDSWNPNTVYLVGGADLVGGTLKATQVEFANNNRYRRGLLVAEEDHGDTEFVLPGTAAASVGSFYKMNINNGAVAVFDTPASGSTRCDSLGWDLVASAVSSSDSYKDENTNAKVLRGCTKKITTDPDNPPTPPEEGSLKWKCEPVGDTTVVPANGCQSQGIISGPCTTEGVTSGYRLKFPRQYTADYDCQEFKCICERS